MRRIRSVVTILLTALVAVGLMTPSAAAAENPPPTTTYYLALGDSLAFGTPTGVGYADYLTETLQQSQPGIELENLSCAGESTTSMINGGICKYAEGSQLAQAKRFISDHQGQVVKITITIGSNDVMRSSSTGDPCLSETGIDATCALAGINDVHENLPTILNSLRDTTGFSAVGAGMTYYDPYLAAWLQGETGQALAEQSLIYSNVLNGVLALGYLNNDFRVAPVALAFRTNNFTPRNFPVYGSLPTNVGTICTYTLMCSAGDIHANEDGYQKIAGVFAKTFGIW
jgi:lysophospholipase L1-like esterase